MYFFLDLVAPSLSPLEGGTFGVTTEYNWGELLQIYCPGSDFILLELWLMWSCFLFFNDLNIDIYLFLNIDILKLK